MVRVKFAVGDVLRVRGVSSSSAPLSGLCISGYKYYIRSYGMQLAKCIRRIADDPDHRADHL